MHSPARALSIFRRANGDRSVLISPPLCLDSARIPGNFPPAWRRIPKSRRRAACSTGSLKLPPRKPLPGDWSRAEPCHGRAWPPRHSRSSERGCGGYFPSARSSSSPTACEPRKVFSRTWRRGWARSLNPQRPTLNHVSFPPGKFSHTRTNSHTRTSSANACKPSLRFPPTGNAELGTRNSSSRASPRSSR